MNEELPKGWAQAPISRVAIINPRHPKDLQDTLEVSFAPMACLSESSPAMERLAHRPLGQVRTGFTHFAEGDVLFAKITPCMENGKGAVAVGLMNGLGCGTTELHVLRPTKAIEATFLYHFTHQRSFRKRAEARFTGSAGQARVPVAFFDEVEIPIPPMAEQRRIVAKLEALLAKVDASRKRLGRLPLILKRFRQAVLAAACDGRLTEDWRIERHQDAVGDEGLPEGWHQVNVGMLLKSLKYGTAAKCDYSQKGVAVLRIPNVSEGRIDTTDLKFADLSAKEIAALSLVVGDILMIRSNGSVSLVGRTALVEEHHQGLAYAGYLIRLRPNQEAVNSRFLNLALSSFNVRLKIELEARSTSGVNNLNSEEVRELEILLPSLEEQSEIVHRVNDLFALADQIEARYTKVKAQVDRLTPSVLAKAFRGELVPQDPGDEPATTLLERMRTAQSASVSTVGSIRKPRRRATHGHPA
ncbi:MAG: restriction endonuclease subunit S [Holophagaceae bacterium]